MFSFDYARLIRINCVVKKCTICKIQNMEHSLKLQKSIYEYKTRFTARALSMSRFKGNIATKTHANKDGMYLCSDCFTYRYPSLFKKRKHRCNYCEEWRLSKKVNTQTPSRR